MNMDKENLKRHAEALKREIFDKLEADYKKLDKIGKSEELLEEIKKCEKDYDRKFSDLAGFINSKGLNGMVHIDETGKFNNRKLKLFTKLKKKHNLLPEENQHTYQNLNKDEEENNHQTIKKEEIEQSKEEGIYTCAECYKDKSGKYWKFKGKNDNHKFCSTNCYQEYYGEYCAKCVNKNKNFTKHLNIIHDGDNSYCSPCYQLVKQEQPNQEWNPTIYCRYCSTKTELFEVCEKKECLERMNKEIEDKKGGNDNNPTNKEKNQLQSQQTQLQADITNLENKPNKTKAEQALLEEKKKELEKLLNRSRKNNSNSSKNSDKTGLYIGCGIAVIALIFGIFIFLRKHKKRPI